MPLLSVIIPVYNEANTVREILDKVKAVPLDKEIIVIDDGSTDNTANILQPVNKDNIKIIHHICNRGKGASFSTGLANAKGEFVIIQDADLEYEPGDYLKLMEAIQQEPCGFVLGTRFNKSYHGLFWHRLGNRFLTALFNFLFGLKINDFATCYKFARRETFNSLDIKATRFDIDIEIVCKAARQNLHFIEVPVSYHPRSYKQGKKIRWWDGIRTVFYMVKYYFQK